MDELAQRIFKQGTIIKHPGWTAGTAMEIFLIDLEEQGMLGYETQNIRFHQNGLGKLALYRRHYGVGY